MKNLIFIAVLLVILIVGGGLTAQLLSNEGGGLLPVLQTVGSAEASVSAVQPWKAEQLFLLIGFLLFNLIGIAVTLAVIFWFVDRGIKRSQAEKNAAANNTTIQRADAA